MIAPACSERPPARLAVTGARRLPPARPRPALAGLGIVAAGLTATLAPDPDTRNVFDPDSEPAQADRSRRREADLQELVQLQTRLLLNAFDLVRPGGRVIYSTCSVEPEETSDLIASVTSAVEGLMCVHQTLQLPGNPADGAYRALLTRSGSAGSD